MPRYNHHTSKVLHHEFDSSARRVETRIICGGGQHSDPQALSSRYRSQLPRLKAITHLVTKSSRKIHLFIEPVATTSHNKDNSSLLQQRQDFQSQTGPILRAIKSPTQQEQPISSDLLGNGPCCACRSCGTTSLTDESQRFLHTPVSLSSGGTEMPGGLVTPRMAIFLGWSELCSRLCCVFLRCCTTNPSFAYEICVLPHVLLLGRWTEHLTVKRCRKSVGRTYPSQSYVPSISSSCGTSDSTRKKHPITPS